MNETDCRQHNQHDASIEEAVDVQCVDQMVDIEKTPTDIENFQDEREEWDAAQHHVREIAEQGADKKPHFCSVFAHLLFRPAFDPTFEWRCGLCVVKNDERTISHRAIGLLTWLSWG